MAKARTSAAKKATAATNGVAKAKKAKTSDEGSNSGDVPEVQIEDVEEVVVPKASTSKVAKKGKRVARATDSAARGNGRARKAPERYEAPKTPSTSGKKSGKGSAGTSKEFPVEAIRGIKRDGTAFSFLVKWEGYPEKNNNWEPQGNVRQCKSNILKFLEQATKHAHTLP